uniref:Polysaccharide deacetylase n=1 Tax=Bursaphelenchus xylophilus TaxID=6326 RepID=A0A1I7SPI9_BURXY
MGGKLVDASGARKEMLKIIEGYRKEGGEKAIVSFHHLQKFHYTDLGDRSEFLLTESQTRRKSQLVPFPEGQSKPSTNRFMSYAFCASFLEFRKWP